MTPFSVGEADLWKLQGVKPKLSALLTLCETTTSKTEHSKNVVKIRSLFAWLPTGQPVLNLCYKLDIYIIQGPSQNASWSSLRRILFTLYSKKHCIHSCPYTKPLFPKQEPVTFSSFVVFPIISCAFLTEITPNGCQPTMFLFSNRQLRSHSQLVSH